MAASYSLFVLEVRIKSGLFSFFLFSFFLFSLLRFLTFWPRSTFFLLLKMDIRIGSVFARLKFKDSTRKHLHTNVRVGEGRVCRSNLSIHLLYARHALFPVCHVFCVHCVVIQAPEKFSKSTFTRSACNTRAPSAAKKAMLNFAF